MARSLGDPSTEFNERELEILRRIAEGQSNREIADQLFLSVNTVRWYNKQIYEKLDTHSRTTAIARARTLGLLTADGDGAIDGDGANDRNSAGCDVERFADDGGGAAGVDELEAIGPSSTPSNLPSQLTPFIGRERDMAELAAQFADPAVRLLTILGPGGMGKTRLSQEFARGRLAEFQHGVYWIALAPVTAEGEDAHTAVMNTLASTLHITLHAGADPEAQIATYLHNRRMLLVIDNFEHLLSAAGIVRRILESAPGVKVIATSREALGLYGEVVYALAGLAVPERDAADPWAYDSIKLFLQTARRVRGDFTPDEGDLGEIARICTLADGLPLGIELAAAWVRSLSLSEIREQLENGLDILESRTHNIRHVFDRSWCLLAESEQVAFARLSIFRGGCTREAIQSVTGASLRMIASLVDKSLLWHLPDGHYAMHELLRQYATEQLDRLSGEEAVQTRHCDYYAALAGRWGRGVQGLQQLEGLEILEQEYQNIHAAWQYAAQHGREEALKELLEMWYFFDIRALARGEELFRTAAASVEGLTRAV
ncbi:MAG: hypothetical protein IPK19_24365 [Chloroflexi bacterium]|nr:hypothetical protein [Chloroflexota bacterium]